MEAQIDNQGRLMTPRRKAGQPLFTEIFHEHKNHIYSFVLKMLGDREAAADIVQDVFVKLNDHLIRGRADFNNTRNWLFVVARNLCLNQLRRQRKELPLDGVIDSIEHSYRDHDSRLRHLKQAIRKLDSPFREGLILKVYLGFSYIEIAEILGTTVPAVRAILFKARNQLRDTLSITRTKGDSYDL